MSQQLTVLYADDDIDDKVWVSDACKNVNGSLDMVFVENGKQVLAYLQSHCPPLLIVLDLNMPELDGRQTLKTIRDNPSFQHIPVADGE